MNGPLIGDFVIINNNNMIGKIVDVDEQAPVNFFKIELENESMKWRNWFEESEIEHYSKNRDELLMYIAAKKYNL